MNKLLKGVLILASLFLFACNSAEPTEQAQGQIQAQGKKYLASNIIFSNVVSANKSNMISSQANEIDVNTKILAQNVILDDSTKIGLASTNVQSALTEVAPDLSTILVGTWKVTAFQMQSPTLDGGMMKDVGTITFNQDGSFSASLPESSNNASAPTDFLASLNSITNLNDHKLTYQVFDNMIIGLQNKYTNPQTGTITLAAQPLTVNRTTENKINITYGPNKPLILTKQ